MRSIVLLIGFILMGFGLIAAENPSIEFEPSKQNPLRGKLIVQGLSNEQINQLQQSGPLEKKWTIHTNGVPGMLGEAGVEKNQGWFVPRFPFQTGVRYTIEFAVNAQHKISRTIEFVSKDLPRPEVVQLSPHGNIPENTLRFYLQFSQAMRMGDAYPAIKILDANGQSIELPFLELEEELWDRTGTRLTLLIDPGRIKRGVKPLEEIGPVFEVGKKYSLQIHNTIRSEAGQGLIKSYTFPLQVASAERNRLKISTWKMVKPKSLREPMRIHFPVVMDYGLLERCLQIRSGDKPIEGNIEIDAKQHTWSFLPLQPWQKNQQYQLRIDATIEDVAGNRLDRAFDASEPGPEKPIESMQVDFMID